MFFEERLDTQLNLVYGPVGSGKSSYLTKVVSDNHGLKVLYINSVKDTRNTGHSTTKSGEQILSTHNRSLIQIVDENVKYIKVDCLKDVEAIENFKNFRIICCDEIQFFDDTEVIINWLLSGYFNQIHCAGLDADSNCIPFINSKGQYSVFQLIPYCTKVEKICSRCKACLEEHKIISSKNIEPAPFSIRTESNIDGQVDVSAKYYPVCLKHRLQFEREGRIWPFSTFLNILNLNKQF